MGLIVPTASTLGGLTVGAAGASLVLAVLIYALCCRHERSAARGVRAFFNFDRLVVEPVAKFVYILFAVALVAFPVAFAVAGLVRVGSDPVAFALAVVAVVAFVLVAELLLRALFELLVLFVRGMRALVDGSVQRTEVPTAPAGQGGSARAEGVAAHPAGPGRGAGVSTEAPAPSDAASSAARTTVLPAAAERDGVTVYTRSQTVAATAASVMPVVASFEAYDEDYDAYEEGEDEAYVPAEDMEPVAEPLGAYDEDLPEGDEEEFVYDLPQEPADTHAVFDAQALVLWDCACGAQDNYGAFCGYCGTPRPAASAPADRD